MNEKIAELKEQIELMQARIAERNYKIQELQDANQADLVNMYGLYNMIELAREMESVS